MTHFLDLLATLAPHTAPFGEPKSDAARLFEGIIYGVLVLLVVLGAALYLVVDGAVQHPVIAVTIGLALVAAAGRLIRRWRGRRRMFGLRKRALGARMLGLTNRARSIVCIAVRGGGGTNPEIEDGKAAAITNFIFGGSLNAEQEAHFGMQDMEQEAMAWLDAHPVYCELAVQSLRVQAIARQCLGKPEARSDSLLENPVLMRFGQRYATVPNPRSYAEVVARMVAELPPEVRLSLDAHGM